MFDRLARRVGVVVVLLVVGAAAGWFLRSQSAGPAQAAGAADDQKVAKEVARQLDERFSRGRSEAAISSVRGQLQTIRAQCELYKLQHNDQYPTLAQLANWRVMVEQTKQDGSPGKDFGPYLQRAPVNEITGSSAVAPAGKATVGAGWTLDSKAGRVYAVVPESFRGRVSDVLGAGDTEFVAD